MPLQYFFFILQPKVATSCFVTGGHRVIRDSSQIIIREVSRGGEGSCDGSFPLKFTCGDGNDDGS